MIDRETDQPMSPQTMRTVSDQSLVKVSNGRIPENCHQVSSTTVTIVRRFANGLKSNPTDDDDDRGSVPKIPSSRSDRRLTTSPDPLISYRPQFSTGSENPEFSTDSVFQEPANSEVSPINQPTTETRTYGYSAPGDREIRPSTTSTEFSLGGSVIDTASQADDLCDTELNGKKFTEGGRITLADYLDGLDRSGGGYTKLLRTIPHLTPVRRLPGLTGPVSSEPSLSPNPAEHFTPDHQSTDQANKKGTDPSTNRAGGAINCVPSEAMLMTSESMTPEKMLSNTTTLPESAAPKSVSAPTDYLIKRRFFLLERLVERYEELLKLMNEELELTGRPPKHYLESMNARKAAMAALNKLTPPRTQIPEPSEAGRHQVDKQSSDNQRAPGAQLPPVTELRATNRLLETRFLLSPRTVRKATVKLSPSANNLLLSSQVSLCSGDTQSMGEPDLSNTRTASLADQCPLHCSLHDRAKMGSAKPDSNRRRYPMISWNKRRQLGNSRGLASYRNLAGDTSTNSEATGDHSTDHPTPLSISLSDLTCRCTNGFVQFISPNGLATDPETDDLGSTEQRRASIVSLGCGSVDQSENTDRAEALAWIEMELEAVRKILEANRKCAAEPGRKRESRKAYQLVCQKNEQTIAQLERQKVLLLQQSRLHGDSDKSSIGCISRGGTDSLTSGTEPVDDDPGVIVPGSENRIDESASATENSRGVSGIRSVRSRLHRSSPSPTTNMVDGLSTLTPESNTTASRTGRSRPSHTDRDRAAASFSPSVDQQALPLRSSRSQVNLKSNNDSQLDLQSPEVSQESR
ncbi:hypothetical protein FGIG_10349 [Fasciola gigantica]|uniref:Uncharacterized protein n=1 Tax=Fasciola gigantica TaxID=46835 RepID=A0A504YN59_FASGI|nr:hypothetical protein FGIG_10349 [Fasciola gigantica]